MNTSYVCPSDHVHGQTQTCYSTHGCRCQPCKLRRRQDVAKWRASDQERQEHVVKHGTIAGYQSHRREQTAPCDLCRAANTGYQQGAKIRRLAYAKGAALQIDRTTRGDLEAAISMALKAFDARAQAAGVNAPEFRVRAARLREARDLIVRAATEAVDQ